MIEQQEKRLAEIRPTENFHEWASRYNIDTKAAPCLKCGEIQTFTIPFAYKKLRGLLSDHLSCGEEFRQCVFVSSSPEERRELGAAIGKFCANFEGQE